MLTLRKLGTLESTASKRALELGRMRGTSHAQLSVARLAESPRSHVQPSSNLSRDNRSYVELIQLANPMSGFPRFQDFRPLDTTFTCIHPCRSDKDNRNRRCTRRVNQDDRKRAHELRSMILSRSGQGQLKWQQLNEYAALCCCLSSKHRSRATQLGDIDEVATEWLSELVEQAQIAPVVAPTSPPRPRFVPYEPSRRQDSLRDAFSSCLSQDEFRDGTIYMVKRAEDPGLLKIGITYQVADNRFAYFESSCGFEPLPIRQIRRIPYVRRVEKLVHAELIEYRRKCTTCARREECQSLHTEWFEIDEEDALGVMERWASWALYADPYDFGGQLKMSWLEFQQRLEDLGLRPTSRSVMEELRKRQAQEDRVIYELSKLRLGGELLTIQGE